MVKKIFRVVLTQPAIEKLKKIHKNYRKRESVELANKIKNGLLTETKTLKRLPSSKPLLRTKKNVVPPYRYTKKWSFRIIFQVFENEDTVIVNEFLHDKENPKKWEDF